MSGVTPRLDEVLGTLEAIKGKPYAEQVTLLVNVFGPLGAARQCSGPSVQTAIDIAVTALVAFLRNHTGVKAEDLHSMLKASSGDAQDLAKQLFGDS